MFLRASAVQYLCHLRRFPLHDISAQTVVLEQARRSTTRHKLLVGQVHSMRLVQEEQVVLDAHQGALGGPDAFLDVLVFTIT